MSFGGDVLQAIKAGNGHSASDLAEYLDKPEADVTEAMHQMQALGFIYLDEAGDYRITDKGTDQLSQVGTPAVL